MSRTFPLAILLALSVSGCDELPQPAAPSASPATPTVAVLDLAAVAKALGRDEVFKQQVQAATQQLQQQLAEFSTDLQGKLREEQAKLGEEPSEEERQQLQQLAANAQRQVQQSQALARQKALEFQTGLAARFRAEVQPVAAELARARGANTVLLSNTLLWFEPAVDITGAVIDALRARGATVGGPVDTPVGEGDATR